jgi:hypothetical protein
VYSFLIIIYASPSEQILTRRPEDPEDFFGLYAIPSGLLVGGLVASYLSGNNLNTVSGSVAIASAVCCIAASECNDVIIFSDAVVN